MAKSIKYSKEYILDKSVEFIKEYGYSKLTVRELAKYIVQHNQYLKTTLTLISIREILGHF